MYVQTHQHICLLFSYHVIVCFVRPSVHTTSARTSSAAFRIKFIYQKLFQSLIDVYYTVTF